MFGNRGLSPYGAYGLGGIAKAKINWSSLLTNTQKTLGIINQAIPAFYQIRPILGNMKTMFKVVNEINKDDNVKSENITNIEKSNDTNYNNYDNSPSVNQLESYSVDEEGPSFFI